MCAQRAAPCTANRHAVQRCRGEQEWLNLQLEAHDISAGMQNAPQHDLNAVRGADPTHPQLPANQRLHAFILDTLMQYQHESASRSFWIEIMACVRAACSYGRTRRLCATEAHVTVMKVRVPMLDQIGDTTSKFPQTRQPWDPTTDTKNAHHFST